MFEFIKRYLTPDPLAELQPILQKINSLEAEIKAKSDEELKSESGILREKIRSGETLDIVLPRAFSLAREASSRTLKQRQFDVQCLGGMVLHKGAVAEMATGEGKTLTAVAPVYLNALTSKGVHVVTVNEYLARRDAVWMGQIYRLLGMSVACLVPNSAFLYDPDWHVKEDEEKSKPGGLDEKRDETGSFLVQQEFLRPVTRREAYLADITYGTNHEFGFDYLRDNLAYRLEDQVQRGHYMALIDEVDSILIDEARTPLIISAPDQESSEYYKTFARVVEILQAETDYVVDEKLKSVAITEAGIEKVEKRLNVKNLYVPENIRMVHYMEESLKAKALFKKDKDYVVKEGQILIVDEFTGRLLHGRRYNGGLHQAIEAKEDVLVKEESRTYAKISIQNYFRMYEKISGMTGTAQTSAEEFHKVYNLEVVSVPTNKPMIRDDRTDLIYKSVEAKWEAVVKDVKKCQENGQPVLVGTTSIEKNEFISDLLNRSGIVHEVLNAKNNEREGAIIAQAGRPGSVTVATNMAGRGVDIILGGNPPEKEIAEKVKTAGGLHVIGTERHEARRIDNQLRGRAGRQGDQGSSQFYMSLDDDLLRVFGGERIKKLMERFDIPDDQPIEAGFISGAVAQAQAKVEGANFDLRKHLLEYDDVLNKQRGAVYKKRKEILESAQKGELAKIIYDASAAHLNIIASAADRSSITFGELKPILKEADLESAIAGKNDGDLAVPADFDEIKKLLVKKSFESSMHPQASQATLSILDSLWMTHLENLEALSDAVGLRAYSQKEPLAEYRGEAKRLYNGYWENFNEGIYVSVLKMAAIVASRGEVDMMALGGKQPSASIKLPGMNLSASGSPGGGAKGADGEKIGRNDPCPCGSGKKYKRCHGK